MQKATDHQTVNPQVLKEHEKIKVLKTKIYKEDHNKLAKEDQTSDFYDEVVVTD